jgi:CRP/FNR family cyclic AMP-dependent transcriptional regulator
MVSADILKEAPFFEELNDSMIERLAAIAELKAYPEGVFLNQRKRTATYFYIVLEGEISLQMESLTGKTVRLETISIGGAIGFSSLIEMENKRYVSEAKTLTQVKVLRFSADEMTLLFYQDFEMGFLIMKKIAWIAKRRLMYRTLPIPKL